MDTLLYLIPALGCGLMMVACMVLMSRMHGHRDEPSHDDDVEALRDEVARLRAERDSTGANADG